MPELTPFQTVGPYFAIMRPYAGDDGAGDPGAARRPMVVEGRVLDGMGAPVPDALIECWQADPAPGTFLRVPTDDTGTFTLRTVRPGSLPGPVEESQAPHLLLGILARGILTRLVTRIYFDDEAANAHDPVLALVPPERRQTLIARRVGEGRYRIDVVLQGRDETVFFDV